MKTKHFMTQLFGLCVLGFFVCAPFVYSADLTSSSFIIRDPMVGTGGGFGTSSSFKLFSSGNTLGSDTGDSTSFIGRYGFLYYPYATAPVLSTTPAASSIDLDWTASDTYHGWNVSGYKTGVSATPGGPYSYTAVGNVLTYTYSALVPGQYCFVVETLDAFSDTIARSNESCETLTPSLTFAISDASVGFGTVITASPRYATPSGGSGSNTVAHTMAVSSNATTGYTITYNGPTLSYNANTIAAATITGDADGTPGTAQFALSLATTGSASIPSAYQQSSLNWSYVPSTTTSVASTTGPTTAETYSFRYLANASTALPSGQYGTNITYVLTGNF